MIPPPSLEGVGRFVRNLARAACLVWQAAAPQTAAGAALIVAQSALTLAALYLLKLIVDAIATAAGSADPAALLRVFVLIAIAAGVAIVAAALNALATVVNEKQAERVADHMLDVLHAKSIEVDLEYYETPQYYDTLHRAQQEAPYRPARIVKGLIGAAQGGLSLAATAALLVSFHWGIALILVLAVVPEALVQLKYANLVYAWRRSRTPTERYAQYYDWMMTGPAHAQELRLFGLGRLFRGKFRDLRGQLRGERLGLVGRRTRAEFATQALATVAAFGANGWVAYRATAGAITIGDLVMFFAAFQRGQEYLRQMLRSMAGLYEDSLFLSNLYEFLDLTRRLPEPAHPRPVPRPLRKGIVFENVSFDYGTKRALADVDLVIPAGSTVALVGENGSGKTTLVKLLARLYDPTAGRIMLDGVDLREFSSTALRREISVIFQDYVRYNLSARENIWFGDIDSVPDPDRIGRAAQQAGARDLIESLPRGFDTVLGKWFDDGEELSVGQWQKIALARALLREAQVIVLDEPTSSMDAATEYEMFRRFHQLARGRTGILISHRLSTVKMADHIYVLRAGRIVESGTHSELVCKDGVYAHLFAVQASGYR